MNLFLQYIIVVIAFSLALSMNLVAQIYATSDEIYREPEERLLPSFFSRYGSGMTVNFLTVICLIYADFFFREFEPYFIPVMIVMFLGCCMLWIFYKWWDFICALMIPVSWVLLPVYIQYLLSNWFLIYQDHFGFWRWMNEVVMSVNTFRDYMEIFGQLSLAVGSFSSAVVFCIFLKKWIWPVILRRLKFRAG